MLHVVARILQFTINMSKWCGNFLPFCTVFRELNSKECTTAANLFRAAARSKIVAKQHTVIVRCSSSNFALNQKCPESVFLRGRASVTAAAALGPYKERKETN